MVVLPGITIGRGCSIGAGSVVTKVMELSFQNQTMLIGHQDVPPFHVAAGNPARILRKIETAMDPSQPTTAIPASDTVKEGPEVLLADEKDRI